MSQQQSGQNVLRLSHHASEKQSQCFGRGGELVKGRSAPSGWFCISCVASVIGGKYVH